MARHQCDDRARINAAGQKRAERHIGNQPQLHGFIQAAREVPQDSLPRDVGGHLFHRAEIPVPLTSSRPLLKVSVTGRKFFDVLKNAYRIRHVAEREIRVERLGFVSRRHRDVQAATLTLIQRRTCRRALS